MPTKYESSVYGCSDLVCKEFEILERERERERERVDVSGIIVKSERYKKR